MFNISSGKVFCPLCEEEMKNLEVQYHNKRATMYFCRPCQIGTYDFDPAFNRWRDADKKISCPHCGHAEIKWFARYLDGFFKGICPKCKVSMKKDSDIAINKSGAIIIPEDMEDDYEPPVNISIPYSHLEKKLGKDKVNELKNKRGKA